MKKPSEEETAKSHSWAYTRLGHIDLYEEEMTVLQGQGAVTLTLEP